MRLGEQTSREYTEENREAADEGHARGFAPCGFRFPSAPVAEKEERADRAENRQRKRLTHFKFEIRQKRNEPRKKVRGKHDTRRVHRAARIIHAPVHLLYRSFGEEAPRRHGKCLDENKDDARQKYRPAGHARDSDARKKPDGGDQAVFHPKHQIAQKERTSQSR